MPLTWHSEVPPGGGSLQPMSALLATLKLTTHKLSLANKTATPLKVTILKQS